VRGEGSPPAISRPYPITSMALQEKSSGCSEQQFHEPLSDSGEEYSPSRADDEAPMALDQQRNESASSEDSKACGAGMPKEMTAVSSMPLKDGMHTEESKEQAVHAELAGVVETKSDNGNRKRDMSDLSPATNGASSLKRQKSPGEADEGNNSPSSASLSTPASKKPRLTFGFGLRSVEKVVKTDDDFKENGAESAPSISSDSRASLPENSEVKEDGVCEVVETNGTDELDVDVKEEENVEETIASFATSEVQVKEEEKQTDDRKEEEKNATEEVATKKESFPVLLEALSDSEDEAPMQEGSQPAGGDSVKSTQEEKPPEVKETALEDVPEEKPAEEEVSLTQEEILAKIQTVDEAIASTEDEINQLIGQSSQGEAQIFKTENSPQPKEVKPSLLALTLWEKNRATVKKVHEEISNMLSFEFRTDGISPIYQSVEKSPFYFYNLERHKVVKKHVATFVQAKVKEAKRKQLEVAAQYRQEMKKWLQVSDVKRQRKPKPVVEIPDLQPDPFRRKTRQAESKNKGQEEEDEEIAPSVAVVPDMLLTAHERKNYTFRSSNSLVEDPVEEQIVQSQVNVWSEEEKLVFIEKLADFSCQNEIEGNKKNFFAISRFLPNKTTRDCIQFYYLNKRTKFFKQTYKKFENKNRKAYSLKNKYRHRNGERDRSISFCESYAFDDHPPTSFLCCLGSCSLKVDDD